MGNDRDPLDNDDKTPVPLPDEDPDHPDPDFDDEVTAHGEDDDDVALAAGQVECPFCGEPGDINADYDPGEPGDQVFVQDCEVCCHPWTVTVRVTPDGTVTYDVNRG